MSNAKLKKIEPHSKEWEEIAGEMAKAYAPTMIPCKECNYPVIEGFCCTFCGSTRPR